MGYRSRMEAVNGMHVIVTGRVQGVFFRARTKTMAESLNLTGWVRNLPDGSVEAIFEGRNEDIQAMVEWCKKGPSYAVVEDVQTSDKPFSGKYDRFSVRY
jgi:acylphosphatase